MPIEAVLPIRESDLGRAKILAASISRHFQDLASLWITGTPTTLVEAAAIFGGLAHLELVDEREVAPELESWWFRLRAPWISAPRSA